MANVTGTYTTGLKDENAVDLGLQLVETAYLTAIKSNMVPNYILPDAQVSKFYFKSGATTYNLDDIYVRADFWRQGNLLNWGDNTFGSLGTHDLVHRSSPVQTCAGGNNWNDCATAKNSFDDPIVIAADYMNSAGIKTDGTLWCWGSNGYGGIGNNSTQKYSSPIQTVAGGTTWQQVSVGYGHTSAIKTDGTLWIWGRNLYGQLGNNNTNPISSPIQTVTGGTNWKQVSASGNFTAAVKQDGTLWLWGNNILGILGDNTSTDKSSPIQTVTGGSNWKQVSGGYQHCCAIKTDGTLWGWGYNATGQLANYAGSQISSPVQTVTGGTNWKQVACGYQHTCAVKTDGSLWCWGFNAYGQLGDNTIVNRSSPVQTVVGGNNWKLVSAGGSTTAAIKTDGSLWVWGRNISGNIGDNTTLHRSSPVQTANAGTAWRKVDVGSFRTIALNYLDFPAGTIPNPPPGPTPTPAPAPCWVARLVYGETNPRWMVFRDWLLQESPIWFKTLYIKHGEAFAEAIKNMSVVKSVVKSFMDIIVRKRYKKLQRNIKQKITK